MALDHVDPVAHLQSPDERKDLVRREVERVQHEPQHFMAHQGEVAIAAVAGPFEANALSFPLDLGFDKGRSLAQDTNRESVRLEQSPVGMPGGAQRFIGVVEQIEVARDPRGADQLVQGDAISNIGFTGSDAVFGYELTDRALEWCESHVRSAAALRNPWRSP